jgi:cardiolipin synthase
MQIRFVMDWNFTAKNGMVPLEDKYFPEREQWDGVETQIVSSGPDTQWKTSVMATSR